MLSCEYYHSCFLVARIFCIIFSLSHRKYKFFPDLVGGPDWGPTRSGVALRSSEWDVFLTNLVSLISKTLPDMPQYERGYLLARSRELSEETHSLEEIDEEINTIFNDPQREYAAIMAHASDAERDAPTPQDMDLFVQDSSTMLRNLAYAHSVERHYTNLRGDRASPMEVDDEPVYGGRKRRNTYRTNNYGKSRKVADSGFASSSPSDE